MLLSWHRYYITYVFLKIIITVAVLVFVIIKVSYRLSLFYLCYNHWCRSCFVATLNIVLTIFLIFSNICLFFHYYYYCHSSDIIITTIVIIIILIILLLSSLLLVPFLVNYTVADWYHLVIHPCYNSCYHLHYYIGVDFVDSVFCVHYYCCPCFCVILI